MTWLLLLFNAFNVYAAEIVINSGGLSFSKKNIRALNDIKFENIVKQTNEYSCGAAALSTILTYYFDNSVSEQNILDHILNTMDEEKKDMAKKKGVSLLDIKKAAEAIGYKGTGLKVPDELLEKIDRPAIALVQDKGYSHFIVLKGVTNGKVFVADPAKGNLVWKRKHFIDMWNGILLVFSDPKKETVQSHALEIRADTDSKNKIIFLTSQYNLHFTISPTEY